MGEAFDLMRSLLGTAPRSEDLPSRTGVQYEDWRTINGVYGYGRTQVEVASRWR